MIYYLAKTKFSIMFAKCTNRKLLNVCFIVQTKWEHRWQRNSWIQMTDNSNMWRNLGGLRPALDYDRLMTVACLGFLNTASQMIYRYIFLQLIWVNLRYYSTTTSFFGANIQTNDLAKEHLKHNLNII